MKIAYDLSKLDRKSLFLTENDLNQLISKLNEYNATIYAIGINRESGEVFIGAEGPNLAEEATDAIMLWLNSKIAKIKGGGEK